MLRVRIVTHISPDTEILKAQSEREKSGSRRELFRSRENLFDAQSHDTDPTQKVSCSLTVSCRHGNPIPPATISTNYTNDPRLGAGERTQPFPPESAPASPIRRPHSHHDDLSRLAGAPRTCDQPLCGAEANARFMAALEEAPASYMGALVWLERCI